MNVFNVCVKSLCVFICLQPGWLLAAEETVIKAPAPLASAGKVMFFLVIVLGLIVALAWLVSKTRGVQLAQGQGQLNIVASLPLGMKEKIAVIQVGEKQLLVGITPQQITTLAELDEPLPLANTSAPASFQELLKKAIRP